MANKIKYGLKNVHYALRTEGEGGEVTYDTPVPIPGAVNLSLSAAGESTDFYADDIDYFSTAVNDGYTGTLEVAILPDSFRKDVLEEETDEKNVLFENSFKLGKTFALLFEFSGDVNATRHVLLNCKATRPNIEGSTKNKTIEPKTDSLNLTVKPNPDGYVKGKSMPDTDETTYNDWYTTVHLPSVSAGA